MGSVGHVAGTTGRGLGSGRPAKASNEFLVGRPASQAQVRIPRVETTGATAKAKFKEFQRDLRASRSADRARRQRKATEALAAVPRGADARTSTPSRLQVTQHASRAQGETGQLVGRTVAFRVRGAQRNETQAIEAVGGASWRALPPYGFVAEGGPTSGTVSGASGAAEASGFPAAASGANGVQHEDEAAPNRNAPQAEAGAGAVPGVGAGAGAGAGWDVSQSAVERREHEAQLLEARERMLKSELEAERLRNVLAAAVVDNTLLNQRLGSMRSNRLQLLGQLPVQLDDGGAKRAVDTRDFVRDTEYEDGDWRKKSVAFRPLPERGASGGTLDSALVLTFGNSVASGSRVAAAGVGADGKKRKPKKRELSRDQARNIPVLCCAQSVRPLVAIPDATFLATLPCFRLMR